MNSSHVILIITTLFYLVISAYFQYKVNKTLRLNSRQKRVNLFLLWSIPFLWVLVINAMLKPIPGTAFFKEKKEGPGKSEDAGATGMTYD